MLDGYYSKEALLKRLPINPNGWYASTYERELSKQMRLREDEVNARAINYLAWYKAEHGTNYRPADIEHETKMPKKGQFRFKDVCPSAWKELTRKLKKYKMTYIITDTIIRKDQYYYYTGYAEPINK